MMFLARVCIVAVSLIVSGEGLISAAAPLRGVMLSDQQVTPDALNAAKSDGFNAVVLQLDGQADEEQRRETAAARRIVEFGLELCYWIEIARCPELADSHPEWMASLQGHSEWRRLFKDVPEPRENVEVIKNYPWVPVLYEEAFAAHRQRVVRLLNGKPAAKRILLNDLQGAPSACGCGHPLCRWTADYGPITTATPITDNAASRFVQEIAGLVPHSEIIPVWTTECEQHDGAKDGLCAGVGCYDGICWKAWTKQVIAVADQSAQIGVLVPFRAFERDLPLYGETAGWITFALNTFQTMPLRYNAKPIPAERLIAVLQGWDVTREEIDAQKQRAFEAGTTSHVVLKVKIDQGWQPQRHTLSH